MTGLVIDGCGGPGGWAEALRILGLPELGIELDPAACATRHAAGHATVRADVSRFDVSRLAGNVAGVCFSPPCTVFSAAGKRAGTKVTDILAEGIRDAFAGRRTRAQRRREMAAVLRRAHRVSNPKASRSASYHRMTRTFRVISVGGTGVAQIVRKRWKETLSAPAPADVIWKTVRSASLVIEPARYIAACLPEWVALEQVPEVLPLWRVYAGELRELGYSVWCGTLNSADYGVPQTRIRAILIASRVRAVRRPEPTHYDPRKGMQLWGTPWVSMADALGWGATGRPGPAVTAGGTATGGAEPFPTRARELLEAERDAGDWMLHTNRDQRPDGSRQTADPRSAPALTSKSGGQWALHRSRGASVDRRDHPVDGPAPTITGAGGKPGGNLTWKFRNNNNNNACERSLDEPAGTLFFGQRSNWASWVTERPATTVQGDPRIGRPGHKEREEGGESQFAVDSVRITVQEAAVLQSFPPDYPWQGTKTAQFTQVGNAVPPLLAAHVATMASGRGAQLLAHLRDAEAAA